MIFVDANFLLDVATDDPTWADWSIAQLEDASLGGTLWINDIVYAELAVRYDRIEEVDAFLDQAELELAPVPREALFLASKVFTQYRKAGEREPAFSQTSSSVRMRPSAGCHCSRVMLVAIEPISRH